jgi:hypothetical protein
MGYEDRDTYGMYKSYDEKGPGSRLMSVDTLIEEDAYNHKDEDLGDIKEIVLDMKTGKGAWIFCILGCLIFVLSSLAYSQPGGSYLRSCKNSRTENDTLYSSCRDKHGHYHDTSLAQVSRCAGDISNNNGGLRCPSYGPIPGGNYQQTCRNSRVQDDTLFSSCLDTHGRYHETSLPQVSGCKGSSILNDNGALHCSTATIPAGTYSKSCSRIRIENGTLFGECRKIGGGTRSASLKVEDCIVGIDIPNVDGYLSCDKGDQPAPGGSYRKTCRDLSMNQGVLSAQCLNYSREFKAASLDIRNCQEPVENNNGQLTCGHVVQQKPAPPPPPPAPGVSAVQVFNCQTDKNPVTVWVRGSDQNWKKVGQVSSNCVDKICPNSPGLLVPLAPGPNFILALDPAQCGGQDDPANFNCEIAPPQPFIGDSSGSVGTFVAGNSASLSCLSD